MIAGSCLLAAGVCFLAGAVNGRPCGAIRPLVTVDS
jgi:hypothetical protein